MNLNQEKCEACSANAPKATESEKEQYLSMLQDWIITNEKKEIKKINTSEVVIEEVEKLFKEFKFPNYRDAIKFSQEVANLADNENHHPLIALEWGRVRVWWCTHAIKGLHKNDFICASKTEKIAELLD